MKAGPLGDERYHLGLRLRALSRGSEVLHRPLWVSARRNAFLRARRACLPPPHPVAGTRLVISMPSAQESTSHWVRPFEVPYSSCPNSTSSSPLSCQSRFSLTHLTPPHPATGDRMDAYNLSER